MKPLSPFPYNLGIKGLSRFFPPLFSAILLVTLCLGSGHFFSAIPLFSIPSAAHLHAQAQLPIRQTSQKVDLAKPANRTVDSIGRNEIDQDFAKGLTHLADRLEAEGNTQNARKVREWFIHRDPKRQYLFFPKEITRITSPTKTTTDNQNAPWEKEWHDLRKEQAQKLFNLANKLAQEKKWQLAYPLFYEVLHEDPNHTQARKFLGFHLDESGGWTIPGKQFKVRTPLKQHPAFNWERGQYWDIQTRHFQIETNTSRQKGEELGQKLEQLYTLWVQLFPEYCFTKSVLNQQYQQNWRASLPRKKFQVVLFENQEEYQRQLERLHPEMKTNDAFGISRGIYLVDDRRAYFFNNSSSHQNEATWLHEATHQLFQESGVGRNKPGKAGIRSNFWIVEGVAIYMESIAYYDNYVTLGGFDADRLQFARYRALNEKFYLPLKTLTAHSQTTLQTDKNIRKIYSQSAGLSHFFMNAQNGKYRPALQKYLIEVYAGRANLKTLAKLTDHSYEKLDLEYQKYLNVTDADFEFLRPGDQLFNLSLGHTEVTDKALAKLEVYPNLLWLDLSHAQISDKGVESLATLKELKQLNLESTPISADSISHLKGLTALRELDFSNTSLNDDSLAHLSEMKDLEVLWLFGTKATDQGLVHLESLKNLKHLLVQETAITREGFLKLKRKLPKLLIGDLP
ncbi:MAG: hypothetical protein MPJ24_05605 [Pirellulaceae bacterium]|nr:hypothetical protein [Pirellulaceae bacterium]